MIILSVQFHAGDILGVFELISAVLKVEESFRFCFYFVVEKRTFNPLPRVFYGAETFTFSKKSQRADK